AGLRLCRAPCERHPAGRELTWVARHRDARILGIGRLHQQTISIHDQRLVAGMFGDDFLQVCLAVDDGIGNGQLIAVWHELDLNAATLYVEAATGRLRHARTTSRE